MIVRDQLQEKGLGIVRAVVLLKYILLNQIYYARALLVQGVFQFSLVLIQAFGVKQVLRIVLD